MRCLRILAWAYFSTVGERLRDMKGFLRGDLVEEFVAESLGIDSVENRMKNYFSAGLAHLGWLKEAPPAATRSRLSPSAVVKFRYFQSIFLGINILIIT